MRRGGLMVAVFEGLRRCVDIKLEGSGASSGEP